jgi:hypothetical protein
MKKLFIAAAIFLLAAGCTANRTNNSTTDSNSINLTQAYSNSADHYVFKYPDGYQVRGFEGFGAFVPIKSDSSQVLVTKNGDDNVIFAVNDTVPIQQLSSDNLKATIQSPFKTADYSISRVNIAGVQGYKLQYIGSGENVKSDFYYVQKPGQKVLAITVTKNNQIAQKTLDSFSFTN